MKDYLVIPVEGNELPVLARAETPELAVEKFIYVRRASSSEYYSYLNGNEYKVFENTQPDPTIYVISTNNQGRGIVVKSSEISNLVDILHAFKFTQEIKNYVPWYKRIFGIK